MIAIVSKHFHGSGADQRVQLRRVETREELESLVCEWSDCSRFDTNFAWYDLDSYDKFLLDGGFIYIDIPDSEESIVSQIVIELITRSEYIGYLKDEFIDKLEELDGLYPERGYLRLSSVAPRLRLSEIL